MVKQTAAADGSKKGRLLPADSSMGSHAPPYRLLSEWAAGRPMCEQPLNMEVLIFG